ncbi:TetR/AcrR family transcriptional regulator [Gordonia sp. DT30]|uniref:TetR/AcrR family transcriptional regulator n=1 Tax=unclassified Gordonia (in: high G+C Gram-positive bacteria) TaxID=2657482 RepID=UPI003CF8410A
MATTRRRGAELDSAIHEAVVAELHDSGFAGLTFEAVAARAGTSKAVLYRRWDSKLEMVVAAMANTRFGLIRADDTGTLAGDLRSTIGDVLERLNDPGREVALGILAGAAADPDSGALRVLQAKAEELGGTIIARARDRGEIGDGDIPATVVTMPFDLARYRFLMAGTLTLESIADIVDTAAVPLIGLYASTGPT